MGVPLDNLEGASFELSFSLTYEGEDVLTRVRFENLNGVCKARKVFPSDPWCIEAYYLQYCGRSYEQVRDSVRNYESMQGDGMLLVFVECPACWKSQLEADTDATCNAVNVVYVEGSVPLKEEIL